MHKFIPHIIFFSLLAIVIIFGFAANIHILAVFTGALVAVSIDPSLLISALTIGAITRMNKLLWVIAVPYAIAFSVYISIKNADLGATLTPFITIVRVVAVVGIAHISNAIRIAVSSEPLAKPSQEKIERVPRKDATRTLSASKSNESPAKKIEDSTERPVSTDAGADTDTERLSAALFVSRIRRHFDTGLLWRLFVVLQSICLLVIIYVDTTNSGWNALPNLFDYRNRLQFEWDLFNSRYWVRENQNWVLTLCVIGPYLAAKAISWVTSGKASGSETEGEG